MKKHYVNNFDLNTVSGKFICSLRKEKPWFKGIAFVHAEYLFQEGVKWAIENINSKEEE